MRASITLPLGAAALTLALACAKEQGAKPAPPANIPLATLDDRFFAGGIPPAGLVSIADPVAGDSNAVHEGARLFTAMNCDGCHGGGATGWVGPSLIDGRWRYGGSDADIFRSIYYGRPKGMPSFGGLLAPDAIWKLVAYLRVQPLPKSVPTEHW